ncbi:MAG: hypothetical protein ACK56F_05820 [bacterium]
MGPTQPAPVGASLHRRRRLLERARLHRLRHPGERHLGLRDRERRDEPHVSRSGRRGPRASCSPRTFARLCCGGGSCGAPSGAS